MDIGKLAARIQNNVLLATIKELMKIALELDIGHQIDWLQDYDTVVDQIIGIAEAEPRLKEAI